MNQMDAQQFIHEVLPYVILDKRNLWAIFSSYNSVGTYESGPVVTDKSGLAVFVSNGHHDSRWDLLVADLVAFESGDANRLEAVDQAEQREAAAAPPARPVPTTITSMRRLFAGATMRMCPL